MTGTLTPLILDFLEWLAREPRSYADVMDAWRTSCPRLTVWEDATEQGLVARRRIGTEQIIELTDEGRDYLHTHRGVVSASPLSAASHLH